jgi:hypothetical protein
MAESYLANPNLKASGVKIDYTREQLEEYIKCAKDPLYFIKTYIKIINVDKGLVPFEMWDFQEDMVEKFAQNRFVICKLPRQSGKSTTVTGYLLWCALFNDNQNVAILANKGRLANDLLAKIKMTYEYLPKWIQQGIVTWNKGNIELENGSKIIAAATSSSAIRGGSYNIIFLDEFAFVQRNLAEDFFSSVYPTISSGKTSKIFIVSTPNGMNHFYKMWIDSTQDRSDYVNIETHWSKIPGRDEEWKKQTIRNTSEAQFRQEFECEFLGSTNTLIHPVKLREMAFVRPQTNKWNLDYYQEPIPGHIYVLCVDTSHGAELDYSAFCVIDVTTTPFVMVAKFRTNILAPLLYPEIVVHHAKIYNEAYILVETNDIGQQVVDTIHIDFEYEMLLSTSLKGRGGQRIATGFGNKSSYGVKMTKQVKRIGCSNLKDIVEGNKLIITDFDTISELSTFIAKNGSYQAEEGCNDDMVMTLVMFAWLAKQPYFRELTDVDIRKRMAEEQMRELEADLLPVGFIDDGNTTEGESIGRSEFSLYDPMFG